MTTTEWSKCLVILVNILASVKLNIVHHTATQTSIASSLLPDSLYSLSD